MAIHFNHTIVSAHDSKASATFLAEMLNLAAPRRWGPFQVVVAENGANLDYMDTAGEITPQHYAFLVSEAEFDEVLGRVRIEILPAGPIPGGSSRARSITTTADAVSISRIPTVTSSKSSPARTAAADGIREACGAIRRFVARIALRSIRATAPHVIASQAMSCRAPPVSSDASYDCHTSKQIERGRAAVSRDIGQAPRLIKPTP